MSGEIVLALTALNKLFHTKGHLGNFNNLYAELFNLSDTSISYVYEVRL